jgi:DNA-binding transcriptional LysR family regulator
MVICASRAYLERHGTPRKPRDLLQAPKLAFSKAVSGGDWTLVDAKGRAHVIEGPVRVSANNMQMLLSAALAGAGIAYGPTFVFGKHLQNGELVALLPAYRATELAVHTVYPSAHRIPFKVRRFVDYLAEAFGNDPPWDDWNVRKIAKK